MSVRELVVLGTASQAPTRERAHHGALLLWDGEGILFDPGEGTQRQMILAGVTAPTVTRICITHFHGDHCLGLAGVIQRLALDRVDHPVDLYFPASGEVYVERLRGAAAFHDTVDLRLHPTTGGVVAEEPPFRLIAAPLRHRIETVGWRLAERYGHLTAGQAGRIAAEAGARRLVLTHFSQRYADPTNFGAQARATFDGEVVVAADLDRIPVPARRTQG